MKQKMRERPSASNRTQQKKEPVDSKTGHLKQSNQRSTKENRMKRVEKACVNVDTTKSNPQLTAEEEKREKGEESLLEKIMAENLQT